MKGDMIVVAAPRCTLLRVTEDLGLCKTYHDGNMTAFSFDDRDNFCNIGEDTVHNKCIFLLCTKSMFFTVVNTLNYFVLVTFYSICVSM